MKKRAQISTSRIMEITATKALNDKRNSTGMDFSLSITDVEHPTLSNECNYRAKISQFLKDGLKQAERCQPEKIPVLILKERNMRGKLVVIRPKDFQDLLRRL
jgi:hypothetical protein